MSAQIEVKEENGPRGGEYYYVDLGDGRRLVVSRKPGDDRVWLGRPGEPATFQDQRGGIGTINKLLSEWLAKIALESDAPEMYAALRALAARKG